MVRLYHTSLVIMILVLVFMGLSLSARGISSLTLSQDPFLVLQTNDDVIKISTLGDNYYISRRAHQINTEDLEDAVLTQAWKSFKCMGRALNVYSSLMQ